MNEPIPEGEVFDDELTPAEAAAADVITAAAADVISKEADYQDDFANRVKAQRRDELRSIVQNIIWIVAIGVLVWSVFSSNNSVHTISEQRLAQSKQNTQLLKELKEQNERITTLVTFTDNLSSPAAREAQRVELQALVDQIGCDNRQVIQEVVNGFEQAGLISRGAITVECGSGG